MEAREVKINVSPQKGTETIRVIHEPVRERKIHEWNRREYKLGSMSAVIDLVHCKGTIENTVIFYNNEKVSVVLDDSIQDRPLDIANYQFDLSDEFKRWEQVLGIRMSQKQFVDFLKRTESSSLYDKEVLMANVRKLQVVTEIKGDYQYDEHGNVSVMYKESNGTEGLMALPSIIAPLLTILNENDYRTYVKIELELIKPKSEDEKPSIILHCPERDLHIKNAVAHEIEKLKEALSEHLILAGSCF